MARIRSVKPELRRDLTVAGWKIEVRYAFVLLWGYLDDYGRGVDDPRLLKADLFPLDDAVTAKRMNEWVSVMATPADGQAAPVCRYTVESRSYLHVPRWKRHQRPSHPSPSTHPPCPEHDASDSAVLARDSGEIPEGFAKDSGASLEVLVPEVGGGSKEVVVGSAEAESRKRATPPPGTFDLSDDHHEWAGKNAPLICDRLPHETQKFLTHHKAKGSLYKSWDQAWRNWMLKAQEYAAERAAKQPIDQDAWMRAGAKPALRVADQWAAQ